MEIVVCIFSFSANSSLKQNTVLGFSYLSEEGVSPADFIMFPCPRSPFRTWETSRTNLVVQ